ncbi:MAG: hypothetical protein J6X54_07320 [Treponema sp.]|nr:hypothetical protein [Treponema sp.]
MINIQNESSLHNSLKLYYANKFNGLTEVQKDGHIYDVIASNGHIYEIQTKNLSALLPKIQDTIKRKNKITIVHPLIITNKIYLTDENGELISKRKSPKKGCIYDLFNELTKIYPVLLNKYFSLEVVLIDMIEHRIRTSNEVQSKNQRRRYKKNWLKVNKRLENIIQTITFKTKKDYLTLLPKALPQEFSAKELKKALQADKTIPSRAATLSHLIIWVLFRMDLLIFTRVQNRSHYYSVK